MALERIDPFKQEDRFCVDHLLRYQWAQSLVCEKKVVDVACGTGFGSAILAGGGAESVTGIDLEEEAIEQCRKWWTHSNIHFEAGAIEDLKSNIAEPCDRVVCFETLEHVEDPSKALASIRDVLDKKGVLIGSVPGERDRVEENEFHLHYFTRESLEKLIREQFSNVRIFEQGFHLASLIEEVPRNHNNPISSSKLNAVRLNFGSAPSWSDTYVFMASNGELPEVDIGQTLGISRKAWTSFYDASLRTSLELDSTSDHYMDLYAKYNSLFEQNGDLQRRFTNMLGWGKYHYEKATNQEPEEHYMETIESAMSKREKDLHQKVLELQEEIEELKKQMKMESSQEEELPSDRLRTFIQENGKS